MEKLQYSLPADEPIVLTNLKTPDHFRDAWFLSAKRGDDTTLQRLATMAENGARLFRKEMHEDIGGLQNLVKSRTKRGFTALHIAARHGRTSTAVALIRLGADLYSPAVVARQRPATTKLLTPLQVARNYDRDNMSFKRRGKGGKLKVAPVLEAVHARFCAE
jgi:hypothetical protein